MSLAFSPIFGTTSRTLSCFCSLSHVSMVEEFSISEGRKTSEGMSGDSM